MEYDPRRRSLADIRQGEYEGLAAKLADPLWKPDFGPARFDARAGATVIGAREFLIAWNVNLNTRDKKLAQKIAEVLREKGRLARDEAGRVVRGDAGAATWVPGRFKDLRGVGWYIEEYGRAQVSFNLTNHRTTPLHEVFDACIEAAAELGLRVTGSELVGLVPLHAILAAGDHYLARQGRTTGVPEAERVHTAVISLGLSDLSPFDPRANIEAGVKHLKSLIDRYGTEPLALSIPVGQSAGTAPLGVSRTRGINSRSLI